MGETCSIDCVLDLSIPCTLLDLHHCPARETLLVLYHCSPGQTHITRYQIQTFRQFQPTLPQYLSTCTSSRQFGTKQPTVAYRLAEEIKKSKQGRCWHGAGEEEKRFTSRIFIGSPWRLSPGTQEARTTFMGHILTPSRAINNHCSGQNTFVLLAHTDSD